ncbi:MAG: hypothetical protein R3A52_17265 [Polyangiales bacterium]
MTVKGHPDDAPSQNVLGLQIPCTTPRVRLASASQSCAKTMRASSIVAAEPAPRAWEPRLEEFHGGQHPRLAVDARATTDDVVAVDL